MLSKLGPGPKQYFFVSLTALEERAEKIDLVVEDATLQAEFRQLAPLGEK